MLGPFLYRTESLSRISVASSHWHLQQDHGILKDWMNQLHSVTERNKVEHIVIFFTSIQELLRFSTLAGPKLPLFAFLHMVSFIFTLARHQQFFMEMPARHCIHGSANQGMALGHMADNHSKRGCFLNVLVKKVLEKGQYIGKIPN